MDAEPAAWDSALCFAITGVWRDDLGLQPAPDLDRVHEVIIDGTAGGEQAIRADAAQRRRAGLAWPYPLPAGAAAGSHPAQWLAALGALRRRLGVDQPVRHRHSTQRSCPDPDELRLLRERPPHHGSG